MSWKSVFTIYTSIIIPLLYFYNLALAFIYRHTYISSLPLVILGIILSFAGLFVWIISFLHLGKSFGVLPQKQKRVTKGIYKYLSHPMYCGIYIAFLGLSLANESWQGLVFLNLCITPLLFIRAKYEEKQLYD